MLDKIDAKVLSFYQEIVNFVQKDPTIIAKNGLVLYMILVIIKKALYGFGGGFDIAVTSIVILMCLIVVFANKTYIKLLGNDVFLRKLILVLETASLVISSLIALELPGKGWLGILTAISYVSVFYFSACQDPPPPEPRRKLVPAL